MTLRIATRKVTKFETCERHAWLMGETRARRAEFYVEGGPADAGRSGCHGGRCRLWPGTDLFSFHICADEFELDWTRGDVLRCPECYAEVWDGPVGSKLAKCWNTEGHADGGTLAFDTMSDDDDDDELA